MAFEINFIPVLYAMVEPDLKLVVTCASSRESMVTDYIHVEFDPEIGLDRLTMERTEAEKERWVRLNPTPPPLKLFSSKKTEWVTNIHFHLIREEDRIRLLIKNSDHGFRYDARLIEMKNEHDWAGHGYELVHAVLRAAIEVPALDNEAKLYGQPPKKRIALYIERPLAEELAARSSFSFDPSEQGDVLVAEREVRP